MKPEQPRRRRPVYDEALGRAIKVLRTEQGLERRELAEAAGVSYSYLAEIENGNKPPSSQVLFALCEVLGVRPSQLHAAADSLREPAPEAPPISPRLSDIAASAQRAWSPTVQRRMAMQAPPDALVDAPGSERRRLLEELFGRLEQMSEEDLEMLLRMVRRIGPPPFP